MRLTYHLCIIALAENSKIQNQTFTKLSFLPQNTDTKLKKQTRRKSSWKKSTAATSQKIL